MRILIVDDEEVLRDVLDAVLHREGFDVAMAASGEEALSVLDADDAVDLVILDIGLPDGSGFELARYIKESTLVPIMFMTALSNAEHRLEGFEIGAEEFVPKPFHLRELLLRIKHVLERHPVRHRITCHGRVIELEQRAIVQPDGRREHPAARDFELLQLLITGSPRVISRNQILDVLWGEDKFLNQRTIDNMIVRLRQSLGDTNSTCIRSVRGIGYQWCGDGE